MEEMHRLLQRQIERSGIDLESTEEGRRLLGTLNKTYKQFEGERKVLEENAKRMLEKISSSNENLLTIISTLDGFNYHVSHDLKTSMTNAIGLSKMIEKYVSSGNPDKIKEISKKIQINSKSGLSLVENFLRISQFNTQLVEQDLTLINIPDLIHSIIAKLDINEDNEINFVQTEFTEINAKEVGMQSLFHNLLTNAFKYRHVGRTLSVEIRLVQNGLDKVIYFKDNGIGIDLQTNRDKIFKPFVRIENELNKEGTGVGLFLVKKIVGEHNGTIQVESTLGEGTEFIMTF
ncbi:MAG: signal transduction histidine kinase [Crocinitomix sp.]|jgi:signal transduction histidine kinase